MSERVEDVVHALASGELTRGQFVRRGVAAGLSLSTIGSLLAAAGPGVAAAAAGPPSTPTGQLVYGNAEPPTANYWDPAASFGLADEQVASLTHDTLLFKDTKGRNVPLLATKVQRSGSRTLHVQLRSGIKFHDGTLMTPADVKASYDRIGDPKTTLPGRLCVAPLHCVVTGPNSLDIITEAPFGPIEDSLTWVKIIPKADVDNPDNFKKRSLGTGPYKFVSYKGNSVTLTANTDYWGPGPYIKTIRFDYIEDADARVNALLTGDVDILSRCGSDQLDRVKGNSKFYVTNITPPAGIEGLSQQGGPLKDVRLRQALAYAIDRKSIAKNIMQGLNPVSDSPLPTTDPYYVPLKPTYDYDPDKAKALISQAGGNPTITYATASLIPHQIEIDQAIVQYLEAVGFTVNTTRLEVGAFRSNFTHYDFSLNTAATFTGDPDFYLGLYAPPIGTATLKLNDPKIAPLVAAEREAVGKTRQQKINTLAQYLWNQQEKLWLSDEIWYFIVSSKVKNYTRTQLIGEPLAAKAWVSA